MLIAEHISHTYPNGVEALRDFSLRVAHGQFVAVVGPSGCGKSTLLRIIAGLIQPSTGEVWLDGERITEPSPRIGLMFQDPALLPWRTVEQNIRLPLELGHKAATEKEKRAWDERSSLARSPAPPSPPMFAVNTLIRLVGLSGFERAYPRELSGGMAQRVALARALITRPPVLLLDEPFGALDAMTRENLTASIEGILRETNTTAVVVTHSITEAIFLADQIVVCSPRPGSVVGSVQVELPRPRAWAMESWPEFGTLVGRVRELLAKSTPLPQ